ncbi:SMI1/KNR4 family protein [Polaribacter batillariae]|uniref:SMI1/KNR4 family protein n=1 Tax=Polaribacter batillariae TaxID=2808900 RepID=A0ABX7T2I0_9FLAO|nr:SMI1/KNR4 family protein [Polaribacter batillariae]QTD39179.1 SMI1/KNR4 family protein [Polaribacter batillariae]
MQINFEIQLDSQLITVDELNEFQAIVGNPLPEDYRQHMLIYNGGDAIELDAAHISNPEGGSGISDFYPIKYGGNTIEEVNEILNDIIPLGYLIIGRTRGGGKIIISLNNDGTYGNTKEWYPDGTINDLSTSFTQLLNDQVEAVE